MKNILATLVILGLVGGGIAWAGWSWYQGFLAQPVVLEQETELFKVPQGATLREVAHELADRRWISSRFLFTMLAYQTNQQEAIKAGEYAIADGYAARRPAQATHQRQVGPVPGDLDSRASRFARQSNGCPTRTSSTSNWPMHPPRS